MKKHLFALNAHSTSKQNSRHVRADRLFATMHLWGVDVVKSIYHEVHDVKPWQNLPLPKCDLAAGSVFTRVHLLPSHPLPFSLTRGDVKRHT